MSGHLISRMRIDGRSGSRIGMIQNFPKISPLITHLYYHQGTSIMLKLINKADIPPGFITKRRHKKGVSELIIRSDGSDNGPVGLRFAGTERGICMIFNYGAPVTFKTPGNNFEVLTKQQNILNLDTGLFEISQDDADSWLVRLVMIHSDVFDRLLEHFEPGKPDLCRTPFRMMLRQNLHIGNEISHNLHAFHTESISPESAPVYTYGRLLIFLSLQFSQYVMANTRKSRQAELTNEAAITAKMYRAEQIIRSDLTGRYTLPDLAKLVGTNECYLKREFKNVFGMPVRSYQRKIKMEKARDLLLNTSMSIEAISARMGYVHTTHFTAAYKKYYQATPGESRNGSEENGAKDRVE